MSFPVSAVQVELHVPDFRQAKEFYSLLGFQVAWEIDNYVVLQANSTLLLLYGGNDVIFEQSYFKQFPKDTKRGYGVELILMHENVEQIYLELKDHVEIVGKFRIKVQNGKKEFRVIDPFGYYIRITEPYNWLEEKKI